MHPTTRDKTLADYLAIAISPVLIMALVGSLIFFLVEVLYVGKYQGSLQWILFFFVFAAVLIARISMQSDIAGRAGIYGLFLGVIVWLGLLLYIDYSDLGPLAKFGWAINAGLIALAWWCAHRLTWDCTLIDEDVDASGVGLLQVAGLEGSSATAEPGADSGETTDGEPVQREDDPFPPEGWWERYQRYREARRRRPHTPGVWIVYFSLAALPLFGLGQALIPVAATDRRRYAFFLMVVYAGSALGLLLATSFLGLRRYLRQRRMKMPAAMAGVWLFVGGAMIALLLCAAAFLPRPEGQSPWLEWTGQVGSPTRKASRFDVRGGNAGEGEGRRIGERGDGRQNEGQGPDGQGNSEQRGGEAGGNPKDGSEQGNGGQGNSQGQGQGRDGRGSSGGDRRGQGGQQQNDDQSQGREGQGRNDAQNQGRGRQPRKDAQSRGRSASGQSASPDAGVLGRMLSAMPAPVASLFKWIVYGILILAAVVAGLWLAWKFLNHLAHFTFWAADLAAALRAWWQGLWHRRNAAPVPEAEREADHEVLEPFSSFTNPFLDGSAGHRSAGDLVRYSFEALQAWAREHDLGRQKGETPLEFVQRLGREMPSLEADARRLAALYVRLAYARGRLPASSTETVRQFWQRLTDVVERPLSAGVGSV
jgi:hypothetical protein